MEKYDDICASLQNARLPRFLQKNLRGGGVLLTACTLFSIAGSSAGSSLHAKVLILNCKTVSNTLFVQRNKMCLRAPGSLPAAAARLGTGEAWSTVVVNHSLSKHVRAGPREGWGTLRGWVHTGCPSGKRGGCREHPG